MTKSKGFSLIELLVVISIIAILVAMSIFGLSGARASARDAKRKGDLEQVRSAIEIYKADCNYYPSTAQLALTTAGAFSLGCPTVNTYMAVKPVDPQTGVNYYYSAPASASTYELCAYLEGGGSGSCSGACGSKTCNYKVIQP